MAVNDRLRLHRRAAWLAVLFLVVSAAAPCSAQDATSTSTCPPDPNATRLFFGPTGRSLNGGSGYVGVYGFLLPFVQVGVSDRVSFGGGTPLLFPGLRVLWVTPKIQVVRTPGVHASAGVVHVFTGEAAERNMGVAYGVATLGSEDRAVTVGAGWGYARGTDTRGDGAVVMLGAERRISRRTKLITENYITGGTPILMGGARLIGDRFSADFAMVIIPSRHDAIAFPMLNIVSRFGER